MRPQSASVKGMFPHHLSCLSPCETDYDGHLYFNADFCSYLLSPFSIVALLDLASENLDCNALVIVLERSAPNLGELLHSLMYVGGSVVTKPPFVVDPAFVLVGLEI